MAPNNAPNLMPENTPAAAPPAGPVVVPAVPNDALASAAPKATTRPVPVPAPTDRVPERTAPAAVPASTSITPAPISTPPKAAPESTLKKAAPPPAAHAVPVAAKPADSKPIELPKAEDFKKWTQNRLVVAIACFLIGGLVFSMLGHRQPKEEPKVEVPAPAPTGLNLAQDSGKFFDELFSRDFFDNSRRPFDDMRRIEKSLAARYTPADQLQSSFNGWYQQRFGGGDVTDVKEIENDKGVTYVISLMGVAANNVKVDVKDSVIHISGDAGTNGMPAATPQAAPTQGSSGTQAMPTQSAPAQGSTTQASQNAGARIFRTSPSPVSFAFSAINQPDPSS